MCSALLALAALTSCALSRRGEQTATRETSPVDTPVIPGESCHSMYYWRTVFQLDSIERQFLQTHEVRRLYIRMFDVVENTLLGDDRLRVEAVVPNATIVFKDTVHVAHVVPTVYITTEALRKMAGEESAWANKILTRIVNMCSYNDIAGVDEIQLDCDWTETTQSLFYDLCEAMKAQIVEREATRNIALSSTIRLHQLRQSPPPVDRGVLMVYNTGSFLNPNVKNSILNYDDVAPYLSALKDYPLPHDIAYPIYSWGLVYRHGQFEGLLRDTDLSSLQTTRLKDGRYQVLSDGYIGGKKVKKGSVVRIEHSDYATVYKVKNAIDEIVGKNHSTILYHLSTENINSYQEEEIYEIYK